MSEKIDQLEAELSKRASMLATWRGLTENSAFQEYQKFMVQQMQTRLLVLAEPSSGFGSILQSEFMKGEASGLRLAAGFLATEIESLQFDVKRLETAIELEKDRESEQTTANVSRGRVDDERFFSDTIPGLL